MSDLTSPQIAALRLAAIVESSDDAIIGKDLNGIVTSWNRAAERMFGYSAEEMIGQSITKLIPTDRLSEETEVLTRIRRGDSVDHFETVRRRKDGSLLPISLTVSPIRAPGGEIIGASKIARDISAWRAAQAALAVANVRQQELQDRLMALVAGAAMLFESPRLDDVLPGIVTLARSLIAADGYAIWRFIASENRWDLTTSAGLSDEFLLNIVEVYRDGSHAPPVFTDMLAVEDVGTLPDVRNRAQVYRAERIASMLVVPFIVGEASRGSLVLYFRTPRKFGELDIQTARAIGDLGGAALMTGELYDAQRKSREEATRAYQKASEANRAKDEFLATLSHELRTPLNAVLGWARMLRSGSVQPARVSRALEVIERNAAAQLRLVEDMLDLSRIITGNLRLDVQAVRLSDAINAAVETLLPAANAKAIAIKVDTDSRDLVVGDAARLQQVVWNLLSNAVKFTPRGGSVAVSVRYVDSTVHMEVTDTGEGIEQDVLPYVFDRFRQGDSGTTRTHMGLGLGLAIVRHIVEMHGGQVGVSSEGNGRGASFWLSLPAAEQIRHTAPAPIARSSTNRVGNAGFDGMRALVIDDDPDALELMGTLLQTRGMLVSAAGSVLEGLAEIDRELPDIILSDLAMPDQDGFDLIRQLRDRPPGSGGLVPAIAVTALARAEDSARSLKSGFQAHLSKPIDPTALFAAVERLAGERQRRGGE